MLQHGLIYLFGLLLLALLAFFTIDFYIPRIENNLRSQAVLELYIQQLDWAQVDVDGRNLILTGAAPTFSRRTQAELIAGTVWGGDKIDNQLTVLGALVPYRLKADYDGQRLVLTGYAVDRQSQNKIEQVAKQYFDKDSMTFNWSEREGQPLNWPMRVSGLIAQLKTLKQARMVLDNQSAMINGKAFSVESIRQLDETLSRYHRSEDFKVHFNLTLPQPEATCQERFDQILSSEQVKFGKDPTVIDSSSYPLLARLKKIADECSEFGIRVDGYSDSDGDPMTNQTLSQARADSVAAHWVKNGFDLSRLMALGHSEIESVADNNSETNRANNRRIAFTIMGP